MKWVSGILMSLMFVPFGFADVVQLKSGGRIEGVAREEKGKVIVETLTGEISVATSEVVNIDREHRSKLENYYDAKKKLAKESDPRKFLEMAIWVHELGGKRFVLPNVKEAAERIKNLDDLESVLPMADVARKRLGKSLAPVWERALAIDPGNETARRQLGFRLHKGQWLTEGEFQAAQGNVKFEGKWISSAEREVILQERLMKLDSREKDLKMRELRLEVLEKGIASDEKRIREAKKKLADWQAELKNLEREINDWRARIRQYQHCGTCGAYYKGTHVCSSTYQYCGKCKVYHKGKHSCP